MLSTRSHLREFGDFRVDLEKKILWHSGEPVPLPAKAVEVLCELLTTPGEVVTKNELLDRVWRDAFVEESVLTQNIHHLRKALKELGGSEDPIQTIPRRGYRFSGEVRNDYRAQPEILIEHEVVERSVLAGRSDDPAVGQSLLDARPRTASRWRSRIVLAGVVIAIAILIGTFAIWKTNQPASGTTAQNIRSIAVLPLRSFDSVQDDEPLRLRITDAVITKLGDLDQLEVRPTNSILRFAKSGEDAVTAGRELKVDAIVDGRLQEENGRLRVTLQLVSVQTGEQLWSEQFDGLAGETLALQDAIANRLRQKLAFGATERFGRRPTQSDEAFEAYLKGRYFWNQRSADSYLKAIGYFEAALRFDPNFALAYSGLADSYLLVNRRYVTPNEAALPKGIEAARRALELDPQLAEAHASMGLARSVYERNFREAEHHFRRGIELNPNYALSYGWYGIMLTCLGRFDEAESQLRKAERLDPTSRNVAVYLALTFYASRDFDRAIEQTRKTIELDPTVISAHLYMSNSLEQKKNYDAAVEAEIERQKIVDPSVVEGLISAYRIDGIEGFWRKQIEISRLAAAKGSLGCGFEVATRQALLGDKAGALKTITGNYRDGGSCWNFVGVEPAFDSLRDEPAFVEVLREMFQE